MPRNYLLSAQGYWPVGYWPSYGADIWYKIVLINFFIKRGLYDNVER